MLEFGNNTPLSFQMNVLYICTKSGVQTILALVNSGNPMLITESFSLNIHAVEGNGAGHSE